MMSRGEVIIQLIEEENRRLMQLSKDFYKNKPKIGCEDEWKGCKEKIVVLKQMLNELPVDYKNGEETGLTKQVFIGIFDGEPALYCNSRYNYIMGCLVNFNIMNSGKEGYCDKRLMQICYKVYQKWFKSGKYEQEKKKRAEENLNTCIEAIVFDDRIMKLKWIEDKKQEVGCRIN